jgi:hypothetical protein
VTIYAMSIKVMRIIVIRTEKKKKNGGKEKYNTT